MRIDSLIITAPRLTTLGYDETETLRSTVWLWKHANKEGEFPLHGLSSMLLAALKSRQFILASAQFGGQLRPVGFMAWACLSPEAERRYLSNPDEPIRAEDWTSGDRMWITDWFTPFGDALKFRYTVSHLLKHGNARALYHRRDDRALRVLLFRGKAVTREQARQWWKERPLNGLEVDSAPTHVRA
jgi:cytolysin-activating lysine-acyltransferase